MASISKPELDKNHESIIAKKSIEYIQMHKDLFSVLENLRELTHSYSISADLKEAADSFEKELLFWEKQNAIYLNKE